MNRDFKIVTIGGGTGSFTLLSALKNYIHSITALVNMADDGGSTGVLRDELGVLPPGDVRKSLVALSQSPKMRELFDFRFAEGSLEGHSFGNLFLTALEKITGNFADGVQTASEVLDIVGKVVPVTLDNVKLVISWPDGSSVRGEGQIDTMHFTEKKGKPTLSLDPRAELNPVAAKAIQEADLVVICAGDLYTSIGPSLAVLGARAALSQTKAKIAYVCNLVTKPGQTAGFTVGDHAAEIERLAGEEILDVVLYNTARPPKALEARYLKEGEFMVEIDEFELINAHYHAIGAPLIDSQTSGSKKGDALAAHRSLIRHDGDAVAKQLLEILR